MFLPALSSLSAGSRHLGAQQCVLGGHRAVGRRDEEVDMGRPQHEMWPSLLTGSGFMET